MAKNKPAALQKFDAGDYSDILATEEKQQILFRHVPTGQLVRFKAFLTAFDDNYESNWNKTQVYGRMDPIMTFQGTERVISIGWDVVAYSAYEAYRNMQRVSLLLRMLYPVYDNTATGDGQVLTAAPLFKLKFMNLASEFSPSEGAPKGGLLGTVSGFTYSPDVEAGFYNADDGSIRENAHKIGQGSANSIIRKIFAKGAVYPQSITLQCNYTVLHSQPLGWDAKGAKNPGFPYGATEKKREDAPTAASAGPREKKAPDAKSSPAPGTPGADPGVPGGE